MKSRLQVIILAAVALYSFAFGTYLGLRNHEVYDFIPVYCGARCLLYGCNPYDVPQLQQQYIDAGGNPHHVIRWYNTPPVYPPSSLLVAVPFALFRFSTAKLIWTLLNIAVFLVSFLFVLSLCPRSHSWLTTLLGVVFLHGWITLLKSGQPAMLAISLLAIGTVLFLRHRQQTLAALLLIVSLALKPQIGGLIVVYFLVKKGRRRYAAFALAGALGVLLTSIWILHQRPQSAAWLSSLRESMTASMEAGHVNDPTAPTASEVNLQSVTRVLFSDAKVADLVSHGISAILLVAWGIAAFRAGSSLSEILVVLAGLLAFSLLPVYHRFYDTSLLLLTMPAILIIFEKRRLLGILITVVTIPGNLYVTGHIYSWATRHPAAQQSILQSKALFVLLMRQQNLELLLLACLYIIAIFAIRNPDPVPDSPVLAHSHGGRGYV